MNGQRRTAGRGRKSSRRPTARAIVPSATALQYRGPSRLPQSAPQNDVFTTQINNTGAVASSAGGVINTVFDSYLQASTPSDWTNLLALYTEFRILSMDIELIPWNKFNQPTTNVLAPVYSVVDRSSGSSLASAAATVGYDSVKSHEPSSMIRRTVKMNSAEEAQWTQCGASPATTARMFIKLYSAGNSNSLTLYDFLSRVVVQFRGRQ